MAKQMKIADEQTILAIYAVLGIAVPKDRALRRVMITLNPMQQIMVNEESLPVFDAPDVPDAPAAEAPKDETKE